MSVRDWPGFSGLHWTRRSTGSPLGQSFSLDHSTFPSFEVGQFFLRGIGRWEGKTKKRNNETPKLWSGPKLRLVMAGTRLVSHFSFFVSFPRRVPFYVSCGETQSVRPLPSFPDFFFLFRFLIRRPPWLLGFYWTGTVGHRLWSVFIFYWPLPIRVWSLAMLIPVDFVVFRLLLFYFILFYFWLVDRAIKKNSIPSAFT